MTQDSTTTTTSTTTIPSVGITTDDQTNANERRSKGEFVRGVSTARDWISDQPDAKYPPAPNRYHLYVAYNCPWCHRVLLARAILGLQDVITVDVVYPNRSSEEEPLGANLWKFVPNGQIGQNGRLTKFEECTTDSIHGKTYIKEIYELSGIYDQKSVPILYDKQTNTVVNNESAEIVRMLSMTMTKFSKYENPPTLFPSEHAKEIEELNDYIYKNLANGSYKAGFSSNQDTYELAYKNYFDCLYELNERLSGTSKFLVGDHVTEADLRLFPVLFRHDPVYYNRMKLNKHYLYEYPCLWRWMNDMMLLQGMDEVSNVGYLQHCKQGYFGRTGNGTIPVGPEGYPECYNIRNWKPKGPTSLSSSSASLSTSEGKGLDENGNRESKRPKLV